MEKVKRFFRNLSEKRSYQIVFFVVSMCVIFGIYFGIRTRMFLIQEHEYTVIDDVKLAKCVEDVSIEKGRIKVTGWCFYKDIDSNKNKVQVFLRNVEDKTDIVWLDVKEMVRDDINAYFDGEVDYSQCGFEASTRTNKLDIGKKTYEIFIKLTYTIDFVQQNNWIENREYIQTVSTKQYLRQGELTALSEENNIAVISASEELNEVINNGLLLVFREDVGMYVYQYKNKLYWVANEAFYFTENGRTYIQYHLYTNRADKLPKARLEAGYSFDNRGFYFEEHELIQEENNPYRVAVYDIPQEYPITYFSTGYYEDSEWIWRENINLNVSALSK